MRPHNKTIKLTTLLILALTILPAAFAHEEASESCSIDPNESSGCGYDPGDKVASADKLDIKNYHITFNRPSTTRVNTEIPFSISVINPAGDAATSHIVQIQVIDPETSQEIYYSEAYEEQPGTYHFRYKPSFAGEYYLQFILRADDEIIKPVFAIEVTDPRATYALNGAIIAGILSIVIGITAAVKAARKRRSPLRPLATGILVGAFIIFLGYSVLTFYQSGGERGFVVCGEDGCDLAIHWHSQLHVTLCGEEYNLPLETGDLNRVHTHKERNRLHYHALIKTEEQSKKILEPEKLSLHDMFSQLGVTFNKECFNEYCNGKTCPDGTIGTLKMTVNNALSAEYEKYSYRDGDDIHITFG